MRPIAGKLRRFETRRSYGLQSRNLIAYLVAESQIDSTGRNTVAQMFDLSYMVGSVELFDGSGYPEVEKTTLVAERTASRVLETSNRWGNVPLPPRLKRQAL